MDRKRKIILFSGVAAILILGLITVVSIVIPLMHAPGVKTPELDASNAKPATTEVDGDWQVVYGQSPNISSVGFTFDELLPAKEQVTSGSTRAVSGDVSIQNKTLTSAHVEVDMSAVATDQEKRDINVRNKIFETNKYPSAYFDLDGNVDVSSLGDNAEVSEITAPGKLTIHGQTNQIDPTFKAVRSGDQIILSTSIHINRNDYGVESPEFVAAKINDEGDINILLTLEKK